MNLARLPIPSLPHFILEPQDGIEPPLVGYKSTALPIELLGHIHYLIFFLNPIIPKIPDPSIHTAAGTGAADDLIGEKLLV